MYDSFLEDKVPECYFVRGGRGNGKTFTQALYKAKHKLIIAQYEDGFFNPLNYVWLIGENENIPTSFDALYGIKIIFVTGNGIKLYKEID